MNNQMAAEPEKPPKGKPEIKRAAEAALILYRASTRISKPNKTDYPSPKRPGLRN